MCQIVKGGRVMSRELSLVYCDKDGNIYDDPHTPTRFRTGNTIVSAIKNECIKLPFGTEIFSLPGRSPIGYYGGEVAPIKRLFGMEIDAASAFLPSAYLRTFLPAYKLRNKTQPLSLWAYAGIGIDGDDFYAPAFRIDDNRRSDPELHCNDEELEEKVKEIFSLYPANRLVKQLATCAKEYRCLCARNFFLSRFEAPIPTTPVCNAHCIGCLSFQEKGSGFGESQYRLDFAPEPAEIAEVILHHFDHVKYGIASFGQGCEGEPLMRGKALAEAIRLVRKQTDEGTINLNTNGSLPEMASIMIDAGLDSIRVSLNSPTEKYYNAYYLPDKYKYSDVMRTIRLSLDKRIFVAINLFFMTGFTDMQSEIDALHLFLEKYPVDMIQTRNLNIDPDLYFEKIGFEESKPFGIKALVDHLRNEYPAIRLGYYNPPKEEFPV
jgi:MoaA/NifB/PqqE/SkfB family radical SAM enzyme